VNNRATSSLLVAHTVRVREAIENRNRGVKDGVVGEKPLAFRDLGRQDLGERHTIDVFKDENQRVLVLEESVRANDGGMIELAEYRRFSTEFFDFLGILVCQLRHDLEHDIACRASRPFLTCKVDLHVFVRVKMPEQTVCPDAIQNREVRA
jgi:hypothetical protein